jgi:bifunctional enzyme CysN/CysC
LVEPGARPEVSDQFAAHLLWMDEEPLLPGRSYLLRAGTKTVPVSITAIKYNIDVNTRDHLAAATLHLNDIAFCNFSTASPIAFDPYAENRRTGAFIIIDRFTNRTVGAGMIAFGLRRGTNIHWQPLLIGKAERAALKRQKPAILWFTGLSGAGKSTIANLALRRLFGDGRQVMLLDGDNMRDGLAADLGFAREDRAENLRRTAQVARLRAESGTIVLAALISPYARDRAEARRIVGEGFHEVHVHARIETCRARDPKGLYSLAASGQIGSFTGVTAPYEVPLQADLVLDTTDESAKHSAEALIAFIEEKCGTNAADRHGGWGAVLS